MGPLRRVTIRWSHLRAIGNSVAAKVTILIPLIGYLLIFNERLAAYSTLIKQLVGFYQPDAQIGVSPRLLLIYFGLCAVAVGSAIYALFCPTQVKSYGSSAGYVTGDGPSIKDFAFEPIEEQLRNSPYEGQYQRIRARYEGRGVAAKFGTLTDEQKEQINNGVLHLYFEYLDVVVDCLIGLGAADDRPDRGGDHAGRVVEGGLPGRRHLNGEAGGHRLAGWDLVGGGGEHQGVEIGADLRRSPCWAASPSSSVR